jgi:hypothetical protein
MVVFDEPGYYSVWGSVRSGDPIEADSGLVQNESHHVLYIYISESGGRVTEQFDPSLLPATAERSLGPIRERPDVRPPPADLPESRGNGAFSASREATAAAFGTISVLVDYWDPTASVYRPVADADYLLYLYDANFTQTQRISGVLPSNGTIQVDCSVYYATLKVYSFNSRASVGDPSTFRIGQTVTNYNFYPQSDCSSGYSYKYPGATPAPSHIFNSLNRTAIAAQSFFGRTRARMSAVIVGEPPSAYCPNGTGSYGGCTHGGADDYLRIELNQLWGAAGVWVQAHEYGHGFQEKALGGFMRYYNNCGGAHYLTAPMPNMHCALGEGFADYFAVATRPGETGDDAEWERNSFYVNNVTPTTSDGSRWEAAIAAFLYDITDGNTVAGPEAHDVVQYSGSVVANVIASCEVYQGGTWIMNNGIDHLVYCFERNVDPAVTGSSTYFPTRSPDPTSQWSSSAVTSPTEIRKLWRRNLYNQ